MKKIILTTIISFGLAIAVNAQKRGHQGNSHDNNNQRSSSHSSNSQKGHSSHSSNSHRGHSSKSHKGHSSHGSNSHRGYSSHGSHSSYGNRGYSSHTSYSTQRIWVAGCAKRVWVAPRYEYVRRPCGTLVRVCVSNGYYHTVQTPGYYSYKRVPVRSSHGYSNQRNCGSGLSISWRF